MDLKLIVNENGYLSIEGYFVNYDDKNNITFSFSTPEAINGTDITNRTKWIEINRYYKAQQSNILEEITGNTYSVLNNPKGTILNIKLLFIDPSANEIATSEQNIQFNINSPSSDGTLPEGINPNILLLNNAFADTILKGNELYFYNIKGSLVTSFRLPIISRDEIDYKMEALQSAVTTRLDEVNNIGCFKVAGDSNLYDTVEVGAKNVFLLVYDNGTTDAYNAFNSPRLFDLKTSGGYSIIGDLTTLRLYTTQVSSIQFDGLHNLKLLDLSIDAMSYLNLSKLTNLHTLILGNSSQLSSINLSGLVKLVFLDVSRTKISSLDISELINLNELSIENTPLTIGTTISAALQDIINKLPVRSSDSKGYLGVYNPTLKPLVQAELDHQGKFWDIY